MLIIKDFRKNLQKWQHSLTKLLNIILLSHMNPNKLLFLCAQELLGIDFRKKNSLWEDDKYDFPDFWRISDYFLSFD